MHAIIEQEDDGFLIRIYGADKIEHTAYAVNMIYYHPKSGGLAPMLMEALKTDRKRKEPRK